MPFLQPQLLAVGSKAPDFSLTDEGGSETRLSDLRGRAIVLVLYPMDETPHCRKQLCQLRDRWGSFQEKGVVVFGVNPGKAKSHRRFRSRHNLPFPLLVDEGKKVARDEIVFAKAGMPSPERILAAVERAS